MVKHKHKNIGQAELLRSLIPEVTPIFTKMLPKNPGLFIRVTKNVIDNIAAEGVRKALSFDFNHFIGDVYSLYDRSISTSTSTEKPIPQKEYLQPTFCCESNNPKIIALSNSLGAYEDEKDKTAYADACFEWVKRNIRFRTTTLIRGAKDALDSGEGMCSDKQGLFMALCRAGGIPARYRSYPLGFKDETRVGWIDVGGGVLKESYDILQHFMGHTCAEIYIDKRWIVADPTFPPKYEAGLGIPISRLGEDISAWAYEAGDAVRFAEIPQWFYLMLKFFDLATPDVMDRINRQIVKDERKGEKILKKMGGEEEYDKKIRMKYEYLGPKIEV